VQFRRRRDVCSTQPTTPEVQSVELGGPWSKSQRAAPTQTNAALLVHLECVVHLPLTGEQLTANPMQLVGRPKLAKLLPRTAVRALLEIVAQDQDSKHRTAWAERDLALILTGMLAGLRAEEFRQPMSAIPAPVAVATGG
jgi:integrase